MTIVFMSTVLTRCNPLARCANGGGSEVVSVASVSISATSAQLRVTALPIGPVVCGVDMIRCEVRCYLLVVVRADSAVHDSAAVAACLQLYVIDPRGASTKSRTCRSCPIPARLSRLPSLCRSVRTRRSACTYTCASVPVHRLKVQVASQTGVARRSLAQHSSGLSAR